MRFNEAIDQALAESISFFNAQVEKSRNLLLGMVGHDLRTPLQSILLTANYLSALDAGEGVSRAAARLSRSGVRMQKLLDDLVAFNRTRLGLGLGIDPTDVDLAPLFEDELEQLRAAYPSQQLELEALGDTQGYWDGSRIQQSLANLISNAVQHGQHDSPIRVVLRGEDARVHFEVRNSGPAIEPSVFKDMFNPLTRGADAQTQTAHHSLGLGLFIVREIALAHGGDIEAWSEQGETVFSLGLPRQQQASDHGSFQ